MRRTIPAAALLCAFALSAARPAPPLAAQEAPRPPGSPAELTLERALELARRHNPSYRRVLNDVDAAAAEERRSWGAYLPSLSADVSLRGGFSRVLTGTDDAGEPIPLAQPREYNSSSSAQGISLSYTLFDGFRRGNELQAARAASRAASAAVDAESVRVEAEVRRRFYRALAANRLIEVEERLLASAEERLEATEELLRVANASPEDVLGAEVDLARQREAVERARDAARQRRLALRQVIGLEGRAAFEPVGALPDRFDPATLDDDALVAAAVEASPRVLRTSAAAARAEHAADAASAVRWPEVRASAGLGRSFGLPNYEALTILSPDNQSFDFGLSVSLPLFTGFQNSAQIAQAEAASADAAEALRAERLTVEREVRDARIELGTAHRSAELAERTAELSRRRLEMAQERYRLGAVAFPQLQLLIERAAQAEREVVTARLAFAEALATLEERVGREVRP